MMAGHPNESQPLGLRNLPFTLHVGGEDAAYNRNQIARQWGDRLAELQAADPQGYRHWAKIYEGKGHWLDREDAAAVPWMSEHQRNVAPTRVVWRQDDVTHSRFYWLAIADEWRKGGTEVIARLEDQEITIEQDGGLPGLRLLLHDRMLDLDQDVVVRGRDGQVLFAGTAPRTLGSLARSLLERADPALNYAAEVELQFAPAACVSH
jgi:hypothetical protein